MKHNLETLRKVLAIDGKEEAIKELNDVVQELRENYLHGKIVERKGWEPETAERKMCLDLLGQEAS